jgi:predicted hydrocarbon binding protein
MKGMINVAIKLLVKNVFGEKVWEEVKKEAGINSDRFLVVLDYPDEITYSLIDAITKVAGISKEEVFYAFADFWVKMYNKAYMRGYKNSKDFFKQLNRIHSEIVKRIKGAIPPEFIFEEKGDDVFFIHYVSKRGLCGVCRALIEAVINFYGENAKIEELPPMKDKAVCSFKITYKKGLFSRLFKK